jgi:hypothetical protein
MERQNEIRALLLENFRSSFCAHPAVMAGYVFGSAATSEWRDGYSDYDLALFWRQPDVIDFELMKRFIDERISHFPHMKIDLFPYTPEDLPFASRFFQVRFISEAQRVFGQPVHESLGYPDPFELRQECLMLLGRHVVLCRNTLLDARRAEPVRTVNACYKSLIEAFRYWSVGHGGRDTSKEAVCRHVLRQHDGQIAQTITQLQKWHGSVTATTLSRAQADQLADQSMRILEMLKDEQDL